MKISYINEYLSKYDHTCVSGVALGCDDISVVTENVNSEEDVMIGKSYEQILDAEELVERHFQKIKELQNKYDGHVMYVRHDTMMAKILEDDGQFDGKYRLRTRLQFGPIGKCITQQQYDHLNDNKFLEAVVK